MVDKNIFERAGEIISSTFYVIDKAGWVPNIIFIVIFVFLIIFWGIKLGISQRDAIKGSGKI